MPEAREGMRDENTTDLLNLLAKIDPDSPLGQLRAQRSDIARYIQGSYDALVEAQDGSGVTATERGLIALRVALHEKSEPLMAHYRARLTALGASAEIVEATERATLDEPLTPRLIALLQHVDLLTNEPRKATPAHLEQLKAHGFSTPDMVSVAQLIAFLSFQVRTLAGLQLLGEAL